jgi:hypothetical protein
MSKHAGIANKNGLMFVFNLIDFAILVPGDKGIST